VNVRTFLVLIAVASLIGCNGSTAPRLPPIDGPWTQFRLNARHDATLPGTLRTAWRVETGGDFSSSPTIVGSRLYVGNNAGNLYAMDVRTGRIVWQRHVASPLMSNPLVANGLVIVGEGNSVPRLGNFLHPYDIGTGESALLALDAATGAMHWRTPLAGTAMATPAIVDGLLIDHYGAGQILALDPQTGKVRYARDGTGDAAMSSVLPGRDGTFFITGMWAPSQLLSIFTGAIHSPVQKRRARDGSLIWSTDLPDNASATGDCPAASDGRVVFCDYIMSLTGGMIHIGTRVHEVAYAIDATTGNVAWRTAFDDGVRPPKNVAAIPLAFGGSFYVGSSIAPYVHALDARDGRLKWRVRVKGPVKGGIARKADAVYFGDLAGYLWAVNAKTGRIIGSKNMRTKFNVGSPVIDGQTLVIGSASGSLIAIPLDIVRSSHDG
jgi:outer membrane protein assembly factor BamB